MIQNIDDCLKNRLLRRIEPDNEKSKRSLELSQKRLNSVQKAIDLKIFDYAILEAYMAMFHAARSVLYKDGIQEKSHYAIYVYLKEKYGNKIPAHILNFFNIHRTQRHEAMYGLDFLPTEEDCKVALDDAGIFVAEVKKMFK